MPGPAPFVDTTNKGQGGDKLQQLISHLLCHLDLHFTLSRAFAFHNLGSTNDKHPVDLNILHGRVVQVHIEVANNPSEGEVQFGMSQAGEVNTLDLFGKSSGVMLT
jgi:hypothetical protein